MTGNYAKWFYNKRVMFMLACAHVVGIYARQMRYGYRYTWVLSVRHAIPRCCDVLETFALSEHTKVKN